MNKEVKVTGELNFQPYFNQLVASNLITAYFTGKMAYPEKSEEELLSFVMNLYIKMYDAFQEIPTKTFPPK